MWTDSKIFNFMLDKKSNLILNEAIIKENFIVKYITKNKNRKQMVIKSKILFQYTWNKILAYNIKSSRWEDILHTSDDDKEGFFHSKILQIFVTDFIGLPYITQTK